MRIYEKRSSVISEPKGWLSTAETMGAFYFVIELKLIPANDNSLFVFSLRTGYNGVIEWVMFDD